MKTRTILFTLCFLLSQTLIAQNHNNLLTNPGNHLEGTSGWTVLTEGGDGWETYETGSNGSFCWATSYQWSRKAQTIDLVAQGYTPDWLDSAPPVLYSDFYSGQGNGSTTADSYQLIVRLLDANMEEITSFNSGEITTTGEYEQIKGYFLNYGSGLRYIYFEHGGKGNSGWAGWYGTRMDGSHVSIGNLLPYSSGATRDFSGWEMDANGYDGWAVSGGTGIWRTSYFETHKSQLIDLMEAGYDENYLDSAPELYFWERYKGTAPEEEDYYFATIQLLDADMQVITDLVFDEIASENWQAVNYSFSGYGSGLRYIYFEHGGDDSEFWAGYYGTQIDAATFYFEEGSGTAIENAEKPGIKLYPNPSEGMVYANIASLGTIENFQLFDLSGKLIRSEFLQQNSGLLSFDLRDVSRGIYILKLNTESGIYTERLVLN